MKRCNKCKIEQEITQFNRKAARKDGLDSWCRSCVSQAYYSRKDEYAARWKKYYAEHKEQLKIKSKKYKQDNKAAISEYSKRYRLENREYILSVMKDYRVKNPQYFKTYRQTNKSKINYNTRKRQASKQQRTPKWLTEDDIWVMKEIYDLATQRSKMSGFQWHVDHIIPLQGKIVCGLHVPENLQVIPGSENCRKHNKYDEA